VSERDTLGPVAAGKLLARKRPQLIPVYDKPREGGVRCLLVVCREPSPPRELVVLGRRYLYFLAQAQALGGEFRNHLGYDRQGRDQPGTEDACVRAATVTADDTWLADLRMCVTWFLGDNDAKVPLLDERTGGCGDGLTGAGRRRNQGAAATLALSR